jgi:hypothetical protein
MRYLMYNISIPAGSVERGMGLQEGRRQLNTGQGMAGQLFQDQKSTIRNPYYGTGSRSGLHPPVFYEFDIMDTTNIIFSGGNANRGAYRLVWDIVNNRYFWTRDHYASFEERFPSRR